MCPVSATKDAFKECRAVGPNSAFLNPFGWILKCVCLDLRNLQKTPSDIQLNGSYILSMGFRF